MKKRKMILNSDMSVAIASDHAGYKLKQEVISFLEKQSVQVKDFGCHSEKRCDYADFAHPLALAVENDATLIGIAICGSGNGINMTVNKHQKIRAALCWNVEIAQLARAHNNANICTIPARFVTSEEAFSILKPFLTTPFDGGRHSQRIEKISFL